MKMLARRKVDKDDPAFQSGPVVALDPGTLEPLKVARHYVRCESTKIDRMGSLSFEDQKELIRRLNSITLSKLQSRIEDNGSIDADDIQSLTRVASMTKQFLVEERAPKPDDIDVTKLSDKELRKGID